MKSFHYTYLIIDTKTQEFYIGVRTCEGDPLEDPYMGSMATWTRQENFNRDRHKKTVLSTYPTREEANEAEETLIKKFIKDPLNRNYYNGKSFCALGSTISEEHKRKISEAGKGKTRSEETRRKIGEAMKGRIFSEETKQKMSEAQKGKTRSEEHKRKIRQSHKGMLGKKHSEETKRKIGEAQKGRPQTKVTCPHCNKEGKARGMKQWHFDNCKNKIIK